MFPPALRSQVTFNPGQEERPGAPASGSLTRGGSRPRVFGSIRRQVFWLAATFIFLSGSLTGITLAYLHRQAIESGERLTESLAQVIQEQTDRSIQAVDQSLELAQAGLAALAGEGRLNERSAGALLRERLKEIPFSGALYVLDASGRIVFSSGTSNIGLDLKDRGYFQIHRTEPQKEFILGAPVRGRTTGTWGLPATRPIRAAGGVFAGIIAAGVQPDYFDRLWHGVKLGEGGSISLLRRDGVLMMRTPFDDVSMGKAFKDNILFKTLLPSSPAGTYKSPSVIDGIVRIFAYRTLSAHPDLVVVVGQSYELALAPWRHLAALALAIWATASAAIILLSAFLSRAWQQELRSEARTELMKERLTMATNATSIAVWDWDVKADTIYASPTYFTMLGYDPKESLSGGGQWLERVHPEDRDAVAETIRGALEGANASYRYEARLRHADGSFRWVSAIGTVLGRDEAGRTTRLSGIREDITERKRTEERLRESEARLNEAQRNARIGSWRYLPDGTLIWSDEMFELFKLARGVQPTHEAMLSVIHPEDQEGSYHSAFKKALESSAADFQAEYRVVWPDGQVKTVFSLGKIRREADGRVIEAVGTVQDVTERKHSENAMRVSEQRFRTIFEAGPECVKVVGRNGVLLEMNNAGLAMLEANSVDEVNAHSLAAIIRPEYRQAFGSLQKRAIGGDTGTLEFEITGLRGTHRWLETHAVPLPDEDGRATRMLGVTRDITERKASEAAAHETSERLRLAVEASSVGLWDWDLKTNGVVFSKEWKSQLGFEEHEIINEFGEWERRVHPDDLGPTLERVQRYITRPEGAYEAEFRMRHKDGSWRWVYARAEIFRDAGGEPARLLGGHLDITERKLAEVALRESLREKEALLKEVHHRVKNNLQVVTSLLRLETGRNETPAVKSVLREMQGRIQTMALLHETLYRSGTLATVDLGAYLKQLATQSFRALTFEPRAIGLDLDLASVRVEMDQAIPCGLLVNELISNGLKHGFPNGRAGAIKVEFGPAGGSDQLRICVSNTGVGLPEDFEARRVRSLGLQLVADLARQLRGTLEVGAGPTFSVTFPSPLRANTGSMPRPK